MSTDTKSQSNAGRLHSFLQEEVAAARKAETKTCPCGEIFTRLEGISSKSWGRRKYCDKHRSMPPHVRQKDIERIRVEMGKTTMPTVSPAPKVSPVPGNDPVPDPALEGITWKRCAYDKCGEIFYKPEGIPEGAWKSKRFHREKCRRRFGYAKATERRQALAEKRNAELVEYSPERARAVADERWEELAQLLSPFVGDIKTLDSMRAVCTRIGTECYTQCAQDMGVAV